jgi:hypothetical protein
MRATLVWRKSTARPPGLPHQPSHFLLSFFMKKLTLFFVLLTALLGLKLVARAQTCLPPTNVTVTTPTSSSAEVNFTPVANAASYTVRYWWALDSTASNVQSMTVTAPPATISGLQYSSYHVTVTSNCTATTGATSAPVTFQFPWATCGTPDSVQAQTTGATTARVYFRLVSGATHYYAQCVIAGTNTVVATGNSTSHLIYLTGLQPGTAYIVRVYAVCAAGVSPLSTGASFTTGGGTTPTTCDSVRNVHVSSITQTSSLLSFTGAAGAASYTVEYGIAGTTASNTVQTVSTSLTLTGLQAGQTYWVRVRTNCTATATAGPVGATFTTLAPAAPCSAVSNVVVTPNSDSTATVSFTPGQNNTSFHITYHLLNDSTRWVNTNASPVTIAGLIPGNTYYIQVTSICGTGTGTVYTPGNSITMAFRGTSALANRAALGAGSIAAYPNPAHRAVSLTLPAVPGASKAQITLLNSVGQQVRSSDVTLSNSATRTDLDLTGIAPGLYTVRVIAGGQAASQRLVVE